MLLYSATVGSPELILYKNDSFEQILLLKFGCALSLLTQLPAERDKSQQISSGPSGSLSPWNF